MGYKKKSKKLPPFAAIFKEMLKSPAWEDLSHVARVAYIHIKGAMKSNNPDGIELSYDDMERIMRRHAFSRAIKELEALGFIERSQRGGLFRRKNIFRLSDRWREVKSSSVETVT